MLSGRQGYVYVLDSEGNARDGWPLQMGDVQAQVAVADIDMDGRMCGPCFLPFPNHASHLCSMCRRTFFYMGGTLAAIRSPSATYRCGPQESWWRPCSRPLARERVLPWRGLDVGTGMWSWPHTALAPEM